MITANIFTSISYVKILSLSVLMIVFGIGFAGFLLPKIIQQVMSMQLRVTPGTMTRGMYEKVPFPLQYQVYILNVTNPDEVMAGGKPKLQEIGPYHFEEYKDKFDIVDDNEEDTMEYEYRNTYIYHPEMNGPGLTGNEFVVIAHPLILVMALSLNVDRKDLVTLAYTAMKRILHNPTDIFYKGRLWDLLYDGIELDCSSDEFEVSAVCSEFGGGDYTEIQPINDTFYSFSLFGNSNATSIGRYKAIRGKKNIRDLGRIVEFNGSPEMDAWYEDECNVVSGTDGTIFAPLHEKEEGFAIFVPQMCRVLQADYEQPTKFLGIKGNRFIADFDVTKFGEANCYCRDGETCPPKGVFDLYPCTGAPIGVSLPHFYGADPDVLEKVDGLSPDKDKHQFLLDFYQYAAAPLIAEVRGQINFEVVPIEEIPFMANLQSMYLPLLWFEDCVKLDKKLVYMLKYSLILGLKLQKLMTYGCTLIGFAGLIFSGIAYYMQMRETTENNLKLSTQHSGETLNNPNVQSIKVNSNTDEFTYD